MRILGVNCEKLFIYIFIIQWSVEDEDYIEDIVNLKLIQ